MINLTDVRELLIYQNLKQVCPVDPKTDQTVFDETKFSMHKNTVSK